MRGLELLADRLLAVSEEEANLKGLLQLLEEDLDAPPRLIELADAGGDAFGVVGDEGHDDFLAVGEFVEHFLAPKSLGVLVRPAFIRSKQDDLVDTVLLGEAVGEMRRDKLAKLGEDGQLN